MLEDFIDINGLSARIINKVASGPNLTKCELILRESSAKLPLLVVHLQKDELDMQKIKKCFPEELHEPSAKEAYLITGYKKEYMPPISIYGVIVLLDKNAAERKVLHIPVGEEQVLLISPAEIKEANEECIVCDIVG